MDVVHLGVFLGIFFFPQTGAFQDLGGIFIIMTKLLYDTLITNSIGIYSKLLLILIGTN